MQRTTQHPRRPAGFTLIEILVVISILVALIALSVAVYANMMEAARRAATLATISKADKLLQQQVSAWNREYNDSTEVQQLAAVFSEAPTGSPYLLLSGPQGGEALALKQFYRIHFAQTQEDAWGFDRTQSTRDDGSVYVDWISKNVPSETDSAELLYIALTQGKIRGISPVDADSFTGRELADNDPDPMDLNGDGKFVGDGFPELVDGWGNPLRFYRWPTRLLHPFGFIGGRLNSQAAIGATSLVLQSGQASGFQQVHNALGAGNSHVVVGREIMRLMDVSGDTLTVQRAQQSTNEELHPAGAVVRLAAFSDIVSLLFGSLNSSAVAHDADDPRGDLPNNLSVTPNAFEVAFHTLDSFHTPLIVSAGSDGVLGLLEPSVNGTSGGFDFGNLAMPDTRDSSGTYGMDFTIILDPLNSTLNDNLTNQMEGLGN